MAPYLNGTALAQKMGKEFMMFETNIGSCGGVPGISDAFASSLFMTDYALAMVTQGVSGAHMHMGGQNASYNVRLPFTASCATELTCFGFIQPFTRECTPHCRRSVPRC